MPRIAAVAPVLPHHTYPQSVITAELARILNPSDDRRAVLERMHGGTAIETRHTALPLERYSTIGGFGDANAVFVEVGLDMAVRASTAALAAAKLTAADVDHIFFTSVTGFSAPSLDGLLVERLGMRPDVKRVPSFGLGCVAGASAIARVNDYLVGHPREVALIVSIELCSLTLQRGDETMANFVASGLFGDGGAAAVMVGDERPEPGPSVVATRSTYVPASRDIIGWNVTDGGFEIVLTAGVAEIITDNFPVAVEQFLAASGLGLDDIGVMVAHAGGPRILEAFETALGMPRERFARSWESLANVGNISSASVLHVLAATLDGGVAPGERGLLFALGPGVSAEFVLLEWAE